MTKKQALHQSLSREDNMDWLIPDLLNLEVVIDTDMSIPVLVKSLTEEQAKIALGITINYIKKKNKDLLKLKNYLDKL